MSIWNKNNLIKVYTYGRTYVISSEINKEEKLQICTGDSSSICLNQLSAEEWNGLISSRTNSVSSPSAACVFNGYGCLGLLTTSIQQIQQEQEQQQQAAVSPRMQSRHEQSSSDLTRSAANATSSVNTTSMQYFLIFVKEAESVGTLKQSEIMRITDVFILPLNTDLNTNSYATQSLRNYIEDVRKFLSTGVFYFSLSTDPNSAIDLTLSGQAKHLNYPTNKKFLWNYNLHIPFRRFNVDTNKWLLKIICGCVEIKKVIVYSKAYKACLFSRLSCERVGARFHCRGVDDHGNCANFVETEQVVYATDTDEEVSFLQLRGSVPVFFEQTGLQVGSHRIKILRSVPTCYPAFERHIQTLIQEYGSSVYALNLLGVKGDEEILTKLYETLCETSHFSMKNQLLYTNFDYHTQMKSYKSLGNTKMWYDLAERFFQRDFANGAFFESTSSDNKHLQSKFIRTNCMDCLDRTNSVQAFIGIEMLKYQLAKWVQKESELSKFREVFRQIWILNGDNISKIYAGTNAIQGRSVTQDITRSLSRAIQNNFFDSAKQNIIDTFLYSMSRNYAGLVSEQVRCLMSQSFLRLPLPVIYELIAAKESYTEKMKCRVCIGTYNINGGFSRSDMSQLNLDEWLKDGPDIAYHTGIGYVDQNTLVNSEKREVDIYAIGFEEIVDLNAQNIMNASEQNANEWRKKIIECLNTNRRSPGDEYVELIEENLQLVGVCLFVFVQKKHVGAIRDVYITRTKTGLGGTAGNKGAVVLRFTYYNTSMCFVCAHFAAHQKEIRQRNEDFKQIYEQSEFTRKKDSLLSYHDYVFWLGDLNYRIDLPNDKCRSLVQEQDWNTLLEFDQLSVQKREQNVFREFNEAPLMFPPTYKYNVYEDKYDSSEKCRVPAWTDRILWRRRLTEQERRTNNQGKCLYYGRADIRLSDHRPVAALLEVDVDRVIPKRLIETLNKVLLTSHGSFQVVLIVNTHTNEMNQPIKEEIIKLFKQFKTLGSVREYQNSLYLTYSEAKYAYEAYGQLNNHMIEYADLVLQVNILNEKNYQKIIEQELMDCHKSLNYFHSHNVRKMSTHSERKSVPIIDLLDNDLTAGQEGGEDSDDSNSSYINVPAQLHATLSITNHMHHVSNNDLQQHLGDNDSVKQLDYFNPLANKALSNSNLNMLDKHPSSSTSNEFLGSAANNNNNMHQHQKYMHHSTMNLLDHPSVITSSEFVPHRHSGTSLQQAMPAPRRPPPPVPPKKETTPTNNTAHELLVDLNDHSAFSDTVTGSSNFDDPFKNASTTTIKSDFDDHWNSQPASSADLNQAPSLLPVPQTITTLEKKPFFDLFDDNFDSAFNSTPASRPAEDVNNNKSQPKNISLFDDSFDPFSSSSGSKASLSNSSASTVPPPLPPVPSKPVVLQAAFMANNIKTESIPTRSAAPTGVPPPLPPLPAQAPRVPPRPAVNMPPPLIPLRPAQPPPQTAQKLNLFDDLFATQPVAQPKPANNNNTSSTFDPFQ